MRRHKKEQLPPAPPDPRLASLPLVFPGKTEPIRVAPFKMQPATYQHHCLYCLREVSDGLHTDTCHERCGAYELARGLGGCATPLPWDAEQRLQRWVFHCDFCEERVQPYRSVDPDKQLFWMHPGEERLTYRYGCHAVQRKISKKQQIRVGFPSSRDDQMQVARFEWGPGLIDRRWPWGLVLYQFRPRGRYDGDMPPYLVSERVWRDNSANDIGWNIRGSLWETFTNADSALAFWSKRAAGYASAQT